MSDGTEKSLRELTAKLEHRDRIPLSDEVVTQDILRVQAYALIEIVRALRALATQIDQL